VARKLSDKIIPIRMYIVGNTPYIDSTMARERIEVTRKPKLDNNEMSGNKICSYSIYFQKNYCIRYLLSEELLVLLVAS